MCIYPDEDERGGDGDEARVTHVQFSANPLDRCGELGIGFIILIKLFLASFLVELWMADLLKDVWLLVF